MAIAEVSIVPIGTSTTSVADYVAAALRELDSLGITYELNPMGTVLEGELDVLLEAIRRMHETPFAQGAVRVYTTIKIDDRRDKVSCMRDKVESVQEKL